MPCLPVLSVEVPGVCEIAELYNIGKRRPGSFHQEMDVVGHEHIGIEDDPNRAWEL